MRSCKFSKPSQIRPNLVWSFQVDYLSAVTPRAPFHAMVRMVVYRCIETAINPLLGEPLRSACDRVIDNLRGVVIFLAILEIEHQISRFS